jgi:predicted nucleic acid-binding protein
MAILVDTNILLRSVQPEHPMNASAVRALAVLMEREEPLVVSIQNIAEFWSAATRPEANNGLGFSIEEARRALEAGRILRGRSRKPDIVCHLERVDHRESRARRSGARRSACSRDEGAWHLADRDV